MIPLGILLMIAAMAWRWRVLAGMAAGSAWLALCLTAVGTLRRHREIAR